MESNKILEIIDKFFDEKQRQIKDHVEQFGKHGNRDIDPREKSVLLTIPMGYRKKLKELFTNTKKCDLSINGKCKGNFSPFECNGLDHPEECKEMLSVKSENQENNSHPSIKRNKIEARDDASLNQDIKSESSEVKG